MVSRSSIIACTLAALSLTPHVNADLWTAVGDHSLKLENADTGISTAPALQQVYANGAGQFICTFDDASILNAGFINSSLKNPPSLTATVKHMAVKKSNAIVLTNDNQLIQWGTPQVNIPNNLPQLTSIHFAGDDIVAIKSDRSIIEWSQGGTIKTSTPTFQSPVKKFVHAANNAYVILQNGELKSWNTDSGALQTPNVNASHFSDIATDGSNVALLDSTGNLEVLGDTLTIPPNLAKATSVETNQDQIALIHPDNSVTCWGGNTELAGKISALENVSEILYSGSLAHILFTDGTRQTISSLGASPKLAPLISGATSLGSSGEYLTYTENLRNPINQYFRQEFDIPQIITNPRSIAAGRNNLVIVNADGSVESYGRTATAPCVNPPDASNLIKVVAKVDNVLGLKENGDVITWESNRYGLETLPANLPKAKDLAVGGYIAYIISETDDVIPIGWATPNPPAISNKAKAIACGWNTAVIIKQDGTLAGWSPGSFSASAREIDIIHSGQCSMIAIATYQGYAVTTTGDLLTWSNFPSSTPSSSRTTTTVVGAGNLVEISASASSLFGRKADGSVIEVRGSLVIPRPDLANISKLEGQYLNFLGLRTDGTVVTDNQEFLPFTAPPEASELSQAFENQLGTNQQGGLVIWGRNDPTLLPLPADQGPFLKAVRTHDTGFALKADGTLISWGNQLSNTITIPPNLSNITDIEAGHDHVVALKSDGTLVSWGTNDNNETDIPPNIPAISSISCGGRHTIALTNQGAVIVWGRDQYDVLDIPAGLANVSKIEAGQDHCVALKTDGSVIAWGHNNRGQLQIPTWTGPITDIAASYKENATYYRFGPRGQSTYDLITTDITLAGLSAQDAELTAAPKSDGIPNLIKWASNLPLHESNNQTLNQSSTTAGIPEFKTISTPEGQAFQLQYIRRKNTALLYKPKFSTDLTLYSTMQGAETVTSIDADWERVTVTTPLTPSSPKTGFGKVEISIP